MNRTMYYVGDGEDTAGPFSLRELRVFLAQRGPGQERYAVRYADEETWHSVTRLPELAELFIGPVPHSTVPDTPRAKRFTG